MGGAGEGRVGGGLLGDTKRLTGGGGGWTATSRARTSSAGPRDPAFASIPGGGWYRGAKAHQAGTIPPGCALPPPRAHTLLPKKTTTH